MKRTAFAFLVVLLGLVHLGHAQTTIYSEDFESYPENYGWGNNGSNSGGFDGTETNWSLSGDDNGDYFRVMTSNGSKKFSGKDLDGESVWTSKVIDVSGYNNLTFGVDLGEAGGMESNDYIKLYYVKDNGTEVLIDEIFDDYGTTTMSESAFQSTTTLRFRFKVKNNNNGEVHRFDNLLLTGDLACSADVDNDGLCDDDNGDGCTNTAACNYADPNATSCTFVDGICETCVNGQIVDNDADNDGVCDANEVTGCTDASACNYDSSPTTDTDNTLCLYASGSCEVCSGETDGTGTVVVNDSTDPTITPQGGISAFADGSCEATGVALGTPATSDNCGVASVTNDAPAAFPLGVTTVTWTVTDTNGNTSTATQTVTVVDNSDPTVTAANVDYCIDGASVSVPATDVISSDSDNCAVLTREIKLTSAADSQYASSLSITGEGDYSVTVRVKDAAGNSSTATATVSVTAGPTGVLYSEDFEDESTNSNLCSPVYTPSDNNWTPLCPGGTSSIATLGSGDEAFRVTGAGSSGSPVTFQVSNDNDDAEEQISNGDMDLGSSDLELVRDGSISQEVGIRFRNVTIPQGATVANAYIQFTVDESDTESTSVTIQIQDTGNAAQYSSSDDDISSRSYTSGSVAWNNIPSWTSLGASGADQATPDLTSLVQEVLNRGDWASGNALAFRITGTGKRTAESHDGDDTKAPELVITLESNGSNVVANTWESSSFSVSCLSNVLLQFDARSEGALENSGGAIDEFDVYAVKDGVESLLFGVDGHVDGSSGSNTVDASFSQAIGLSDVGQLSIRIKSRLTQASESYSFDDFKVCVDENNNGLCDVDECVTTTVTASAATVDLGADGQVTVDGTTVGAGYAGDCFVPSVYEVSKDGSTYGSSTVYSCSELGSNTLYVRGTNGSSTSAPVTVQVTVQDVTDPVAAAQNITVQLDANGVASITAGDIENGSTDNCSIASSSLDITSFSCSDVGSPVTVTLTVTDPGGNSDTATATVTLEDNVDPTISAPATVNVNTSSYGGTCSVPGSLALGSPTTADNCSVASVTNDPPSSYPVGTTVVTWTVTDGSGNTATATQNVVVTDDQLPTTPTFANTSFQLNMSSVVVGVSDLSISASDDCTDSGSLTYEISRDASTWGSTVSFGCADATGQFWPIYVRVTDAANNTSANGVGNVTITDAALQAVGQNVTVSLAADGSYTLTAAEVDNGSSGNCGSTLSVSPNTFDCDDLGDNVVTLTVSDGSTSDATTVTVTIEDTTAPNVSLATSYSVDLGTDGTAGILPTDVATLTGDADACTPNGAVTFQIKRENGTFGNSVSVDCSDIGLASFNVVVTAIDAEGNAFVSGNIPVTVNDDEAPVISSISSGLTEVLSSAGTSTISASAYITASDNCTASGSLTYEISESSGSGFATTFAADCDDIGAKTFYFRVTDEATNASAESSGTITIADNTDPTAVANDRTLPLNGASTVTLQADDAGFNTSTDNCTVTSEIKLTSAGDGTYASSYEFPGAGSYDVTLRVTDPGGNTATDNATITVISEPDDIIIYFEDFESEPVNAVFTEGAGEESQDGKWTVDDLGTGYGAMTQSIASCTTGTSYSVVIEFTRDYFGSEFSWELKNSNQGTEDSGGPYSDGCTNVVFSSSQTLSGGVYTLTLDDSMGDGWGVYTTGNCNNPPEITVTIDGVLVSIITPGNFGSTVSYDIPVGCSTDNVFEIQQGSAVAWYSREIDISAFEYVEIDVDVSENGDADNDGFVLSTLIDGGSATAQLTDTDGNFTGTRSVSGITGDVLIVKLEAQTGSGGEIGFDNIKVTGYCIDLDGNDICDSEQDCVETAGKDCGCMDKTACTYEADATHASADSCFYPGMEFQGAACGSAGQFVFYDSDCSCASENWTSAYSENFNDEADSDGFAEGTYANVTGNDVNDDDGSWSINVGSPSTAYFFGAFDYSLTNADARTFNARDVDGTATWSSVEESVGSASYVKVNADLSYGVGNFNFDASGGFDIDDEVRAYLTRDGVAETDEFGAIKGGGNSGNINAGNIELASEAVYRLGDESSVGIRVIHQHDRETIGGTTASDEITIQDDIILSFAGVRGCMSPGAGGYSSSVTYDDGSCTWSEVTVYSRYDGGFQDKIWEGTACSGENGVCGTAPYPNARQVGANDQTNQTTISYVISSGTTVTVNGTTDIDGDPTTKDLFVQDLTIKSGGVLVIPAGKRLRVMGTFKDEDGNGVSGLGMLCIDGGFEIPSDGPAVVTVQDFELPPGSSVDVADGKTLAIEGDLAFGDTDPASVSGLVELSGGDGQSISGDGATLDELQISNTAGVTVNDSLEIQGRLTLDDNTELAMGSNPLSFASRAVSGSPGGDKTAVLDAIPSNASITGPPARALQSSNTDFTAEVERYFAPDGDGSTNWGYSMYGTSIAGVTASDLNDVGDFYSAGWPGSDYPNATSTVSFWNESTGSIEYASSASTSLTDRGCWVLLYGTQTPTFELQGTLNNHKIGGPSKVFSVTRQGPDTLSSGWNMLYNPYQARLDWDEVYESNSNSDVIEDQFLVFDTQLRRFRRYGKNTAGVQWSNDQEAGEDSIAMQYVNPGQGFWVRVKSGETSGSVTLDPSMIDNDGTAVDFIRNASAGEFEVLVEVENDNGANRMLLKFGAEGSTADYVEGDMSYRGSSNSSGESAFMVNGHKYVAKKLPLDSFDGDLFVRSRANMASTLRVVQVLGSPSICAHIEDHETGETMVLEAGAELAFTLPAHEAEAGRFTLHSTPFGSMEGRAPDCPESAAGSIVMEFGDAVADVVVTNYETMQVAAMLYQETGTVELDIEPGEYAVMVEAMEGTSMCRGGRRHVIVAPGEQPELLGLDPMPSDCNEGMASLAFELYGSGDYATTLMQGNTTVWSETLPAGEHLLQDIVPGDYVLSVQHACLEANEWVVLSDLGMPVVAPVYPFFTDAEVNGGAWLEATCMGCQTGEGYGYYWMMGEDVLGENAPLEFRVDAVGAYDLELVAFGPGCEVNLPFEMLVGKNKVLSPDEVLWGRVSESVLEVTLNSEWHNASLRWYDSSGRLLSEETKGAMLGTVRLAVPQSPGWLTLEVWNDQGQVARWSGIY